MSTRSRAGFTLVELALVILILVVLVALLFPVLSSARRSSRVAKCTSNLRQLGAAVRMYVDEYGAYPLLGRVFRSSYLRDRRVLVCPEDSAFVPKGAYSSYPYRMAIPPDFQPVEGSTEIDGGVVLLSCESHLGRTTILRGEETLLSDPRYPYYLVLRASGSVDRVHFSKVVEVPVPAPQPTFTLSYPGEPAFHSGGRQASAR